MTLPNPCIRPAAFICDRLGLGEKKCALNQELFQLNSGKKNCAREYYVRKIANTLLVSFGALILLAAVLITEARKDRSVSGGILTRPGYGENASSSNLNLTISGEEESEAFEILLEPRSYSRVEVRAFLTAAQEELAGIILQDNESLDYVSRPLSFPETLQNGIVEASYEVTPYGMIDENGMIVGEVLSAGSIVNITVTLSCQSQVRTWSFSARLYPQELTDSEQLHMEIRRAVRNAQEKDPENESIRLPSKIGDRTLRWYYPKSSAYYLLILFAILTPCLLWTHSDQKIHDEAKARHDQLDLDYSEMLWKLTMLLGAGLTIRGAFARVTAQYQAEKAGKRYVYEEMLLALREMKSGVPEAVAYENFGRRCGLPTYIKLGSLLSQNLKKGSRGLTRLLEREALMSMEQHKMIARKLGEKAGIKMLLPMIMMFGVVLAVIMVPAFLAM